MIGQLSSLLSSQELIPPPQPFPPEKNKPHTKYVYVQNLYMCVSLPLADVLAQSKYDLITIRL